MRNFNYVLKNFYFILLVFLLVGCGSDSGEESTTSTDFSDETIAVTGTINSSESGSGNIIIKLVDDFKNFNTAVVVGSTTLSVNGDFSFNVSKNIGAKHLLIFVDTNDDGQIGDNEYYGAYEITISSQNYIITNLLTTSYQYLIPDLSEVTGTWLSGCQLGKNSDDFNMVQSLTFSINGNNQQLNDYYESDDDSCTGSVVNTEEINGTYSLGDPLPLLSNTNKINLVVTGWTWTPKDTTVVNHLNTSEVCGFADWTNGQAKSIAGLDCNGYQPPAVGETLYDIIELQSSSALMYSGTTSGTSGATRPTSVNISITYIKQIDNTPPTAPSSFTATAGDEQVTLSWTNPSDLDFIGVEIRRSLVSNPNSVTDGESVYTGSGTSKVDSDVTGGTEYFYAIFAQDSSSNWSVPATDTATPAITGGADTTAPSAPSGFSATAGDGEVVLNWTNPTDSDFVAVQIMRSTVASPTIVTDGLWVYTNNGTTETDTNVSNNMTYYYSIFARDADQNWSVAATALATPTVPVAGIDLVASVDNVAYDGTNVTITYTVTNNGSQSTDGTFFHVRFWENSASQPNLSDENYRINTSWTNIHATQNSLIGAGVSRTASQIFSASTFPAIVTSGTAWVGVDFSNVIAEADETNNVSNGVGWGSADSTAPANPTGFSATIGDGQIVLNWTNPGDSDFAGVEIRRATGSAPNTESDGTSVYVGTLTTYIDSDVSNGTAYYYSIFAKDEVPNWSTGVNDSATPTGSGVTACGDAFTKVTPSTLTLGTACAAAEEDSPTQTFYTFTTSSSGTYTINGSDMQARNFFYLYDNSSFTSPSLNSSCYNAINTTTATCDVDLSADTAYYLNISTLSGSSGDTFNLTINAPSGAGGASTQSYSNNTRQDIPDSDSTGVSSTVTVSSGATSIGKITVTVNITHTFTSDIDLYLQPPRTGDTISDWIALSTDNGSDGDHYTNTVFDDDATTDITTGTAPFTGTFTPEVSLSSLNGSDANGNWVLHVFDDLEGDIGSLDNWTLTITEVLSTSSAAFDFEDGNIPNVFTMSGNAPWVIDSSNTANGSSYSLKAGSINHSQTSCVSFTTSTATTYISFYDKISTEDAYDKMKFSVDNIDPTTHIVSGDVDWTKREYNSLSNQTHTFKWCYDKDVSNSLNLDTIWIDDIRLVSP